jgi:hypothetical protein
MKACVVCNSKDQADVPGGPIEYSGTTSLRCPLPELVLVANRVLAEEAEALITC